MCTITCCAVLDADVKGSAVRSSRNDTAQTQNGGYNTYACGSARVEGHEDTLDKTGHQTTRYHCGGDARVFGKARK